MVKISFKRICDIIHNNCSVVILQISHAGCGASRDVTGFQPVSSSNTSVPCGWPDSKPNPELPRSISFSFHPKKSDFPILSCKIKRNPPVP